MLIYTLRKKECYKFWTCQNEILKLYNKYILRKIVYSFKILNNEIKII